jgi:hypothetical protein
MREKVLEYKDFITWKNLDGIRGFQNRIDSIRQRNQLQDRPRTAQNTQTIQGRYTIFQY